MTHQQKLKKIEKRNTKENSGKRLAQAEATQEENYVYKRQTVFPQ